MSMKLKITRATALCQNGGKARRDFHLVDVFVYSNFFPSLCMHTMVTTTCALCDCVCVTVSVSVSVCI